MTLEEAWRRRLSHHHALWTSPLLMPGAVFEKPLEAIAIKLTVSVSGAGDEEPDADLVRGRRSVLVAHFDRRPHGSLHSQNSMHVHAYRYHCT